MPTTRRQRSDFKIEVLSFDEDTGLVQVALTPDPRRYEKIEINGKTEFLDKYLNCVMGQEVLQSMADQMKGTPIYILDPKISNTQEYANARIDPLRAQLETGKYLAPNEQPYLHKPLLSEQEIPVTFVSLDICGATALRTQNPAGFDKAHEIMISELGTTVGQFGGAILKVTGDGFIAFFDHPSFTRQSDNAIDLGLSLITVLREAVNVALEEKGLPLLKIRVGAEHGDAVMKRINIPSTGFSALDVVSDALNYAVKIQESCRPNEFRIGRYLYETAHVQWLERAEVVPPSPENQFGIPRYQIYSVR
jgi:class 3 adenylate cyclase